MVETTKDLSASIALHFANQRIAELEADRDRLQTTLTNVAERLKRRRYPIVTLDLDLLRLIREALNKADTK